MSVGVSDPVVKVEDQSKSYGCGGSVGLLTAKIESSLIADQLVAIKEEYLIPPNYELLLPGEHREIDSLVDTDILVYLDALKVSLQFPLPSFFVKLLKYYGLSVSQLTPNDWMLVCSFTKACYDLHIDLPMFQHLFLLTKKEEHYHFSGCSGNVMFGGLRKSWRTWKPRYFILRNLKGWDVLPLVWNSRPRKSGHVVLTVKQASKVDVLRSKACRG